MAHIQRFFIAEELANAIRLPLFTPFTSLSLELPTDGVPVVKVNSGGEVTTHDITEHQLRRFAEKIVNAVPQHPIDATMTFKTTSGKDYQSEFTVHDFRRIGDFVVMQIKDKEHERHQPKPQPEQPRPFWKFW